ncbi:MAG: RsfS/YbeB/iojap family protein, partial [Bifidobacteriaceae bacterium]|nr:RsfS/YbeB/iojap family protein [Bifidobacteriaceae bacterium]
PRAGGHVGCVAVHGEAAWRFGEFQFLFREPAGRVDADEAFGERAEGEDVFAVTREGDQTNRWVLLDFGEVVVHVQHTEDREFYGLDRLWKDCPRVALPTAEPRVEEHFAVAGQALGAPL